MHKLIIAAILIAIITGCGIANKVQTRNQMRSSLNIYRQCLTENPDNIEKCESCRLIYEADLKAYRASCAGLSRRNSTIVVEK